MPNLSANLLTDAARLANQWVASALARGLGPTEALTAYRSSGMRIRTQTWYDVWALAKTGSERVSRISATPLDKVPSLRHFTPALTRQLRRYAYNVSFTIYDPTSGERDVRNITVSTSILLTRREVNTRAVDAYTMDGSRYTEFELSDFKIVGATISESPLLSED